MTDVDMCRDIAMKLGDIAERIKEHVRLQGVEKDMSFLRGLKALQNARVSVRAGFSLVKEIQREIGRESIQKCVKKVNQLLGYPPEEAGRLGSKGADAYVSKLIEILELELRMV